MVNRQHSLLENEYYHIYNRGNSKQVIFLDQQDYLFFQHLLYLMNMEKRVTSREIGESSYSYPRGEPLVSIGAYCLMPNHFHILVKQKSEKGISKFMQKISTAYAMYFNNKYKRSGGLFEGTFKSKHIANDHYMRYLYSYVHLNPMKLINPFWKEIISTGGNIEYTSLFEYSFSSAQDYLGKERSQNIILNTIDFPDYFKDVKGFRKNLETWFTIDNQNIQNT